MLTSHLNSVARDSVAAGIPFHHVEAQELWEPTVHTISLPLSWPPCRFSWLLINISPVKIPLFILILSRNNGVVHRKESQSLFEVHGLNLLSDHWKSLVNHPYGLVVKANDLANSSLLTLRLCFLFAGPRSPLILRLLAQRLFCWNALLTFCSGLAVLQSPMKLGV